MLIRSTESIVGGAPAADGVRVVRKMSVFPLLSFGTRLLAADAHATRILLLAVSRATARLVHFPAFWALHCSELPVGSTFLSPPASGMLIRSSVPGAALATGPPRAAISATAPASDATCRRRPNPDDRDVLMAALTLPSLVNTTHKIGQKPQNVDAERLKRGFNHLKIGFAAGRHGDAGHVEAHFGESGRP